MIASWIFAAVVSYMLAGIGVLLGVMIVDSQLNRTVHHLFQFTRHMIYKAIIRTIEPEKRRSLEVEDHAFSILSPQEKEQRMDPQALQAVKTFKRMLKEIYGEKLVAVYFFGSRARGSYGPWSDLDLILFFESSISLPGTKSQVAWAALQILMQEGLLIQPHLVSSRAIDQAYPPPHPVVRRALQTGIRI